MNCKDNLSHAYNARIYYERMGLKERITAAREAARMKQTALARACGVTPAAINKLESGDTKNISGELLLKIANACQVSPFDLGGVRDTRHITREREPSDDAPTASLIESLAQLEKSEQVKAIARAIHALAASEDRTASSLSPQEQQLLDAFRHLSDDQRGDILFEAERRAAHQKLLAKTLRKPPLNGTK